MDVDAQAVIDALRRQLDAANYQRALAEAQTQQITRELEEVKEADRGQADQTR